MKNEVNDFNGKITQNLPKIPIVSLFASIGIALASLSIISAGNPFPILKGKELYILVACLASIQFTNSFSDLTYLVKKNDEKLSRFEEKITKFEISMNGNSLILISCISFLNYFFKT